MSSAPEHDLALRGGTIVTADGMGDGDIGIRAGRIVQLGRVGPAREEIDVSGLEVMPGGVDMHVHLTPGEMPDGSYRHADDFLSGTRSALIGGITTVGNMTFARPGETLPDGVNRVLEEAEATSVADFVLHPVIWDFNPEIARHLTALADAGHMSIKIFMNVAAFDERPGAFLAAMQLAGQHGMMTMMHCEDAAIIDHLTRELDARGTGISGYPDSHPVQSEAAAVARAIAMARTADTPLYVVHLSSSTALELCRDALAEGQPVFVETRPVYLHFDRRAFEREDAALFVGNPPLRTPEDQLALWRGLAAGHIHTCCSDHAPWTREEKMQATEQIAGARPGMSDLDTLMPLLFSEGVMKGRITSQRFVQVTATNAARLFGLFPRKGTIAVGSDADLVVWDRSLTRDIHASESHSRSGFSLYENWRTAGWPAYTISRGEVVAAGGALTEAAVAGRGTVIPRGSCARML
jgi:dihydropyrimidinase